MPDTPTPAPDVTAKLADWFADCKVCPLDVCGVSPDPHVHVHITFDIPQRDLIVARLRAPAPASLEGDGWNEALQAAADLVIADGDALTPIGLAQEILAIKRAEGG